MANYRRRRKETSAECNARLKRNQGCSSNVWFLAKKRNTKFFGSHLWLVDGGEKQHVVYLDQTAAVCDCNNQEHAYNQVCCHIQAVKNRLLEAMVGKK